MTAASPVRTSRVDRLAIEVYETEEDLGRAAAADAADQTRQAIEDRGEANLILATGNSQLAFLRAFRSTPDVDWSNVRVFHMDEYVGIDPSHRASFPGFLREHFLDHVDVGTFHPISGDAARAEAICRDYEARLREYPADLVALGFGENGHLAFNDPPYADFEDDTWVKVVRLDEVSRMQQVGEGHFDTLDEVPTEAITLTIPALLAPKRILCIVPEARKANAVYACLHEPIDEGRPGSILRRCDHAKLYLDPRSSARISVASVDRANPVAIPADRQVAGTRDVEGSNE